MGEGLSFYVSQWQADWPTISVMREFELLSHIYKANKSLPDCVTIPPGDDMASVCVDGTDTLITVDQLADGVHIDLARTPIEKVGRKAITRSLSDVAAMASLPIAAVVGVSLPRGFSNQSSKRLFDAMRQIGASYGCPLIGGDVSIWDHPLVITVTVMAHTGGGAPVMRRGAQPGDGIYVTGHLGGSGYTLEGYTQHLDFEPRIGLARKLATDPNMALHCMIDLSDGLGVDLARLCHAADAVGCLGAVLETDRLPISPAAYAASRESGRLPWHHAIGDGEDYELCFTVAAPQANAVVPVTIEGVPITRIGQIVEADAGTIMIKQSDGSIHGVEGIGWEHRG